MDAPRDPAMRPTRRHIVRVYFLGTYLLSWTGALSVAFPYILQHRPVSKLAGLLMFPVMLLGPSLIGVLLIATTDGKRGLIDLLQRMSRFQVAPTWYATLLLPPALIAAVLFALQTFVSPSFTPNHFFIGFSFGIAAGFLEEIGWTGFALPKMLPGHGWLRTGLLLGVLWGFWHLPVIDFVGAAFPHQNCLIPFAAAFIAAMTAVRTIMVWVYSHTRSVLMAQLIHAMSTGSLVALGPASVTPAQETIWYACYAAALWMVVAGAYLLQRKIAAS